MKVEYHLTFLLNDFSKYWVDALLYSGRHIRNWHVGFVGGTDRWSFFFWDQLNLQASRDSLEIDPKGRLLITA
jgi:hypothetical protein